MGLGNYLPTEILRKVVPRLPSRWQRFAPASSWADAEGASLGYLHSAVGSPLAKSEPSNRPQAGNQTALLAAFGLALTAYDASSRPVKVVDFGGYDGKHADLVMALFPWLAFDWIVVDLPPVIEAMSNRSRPGLSFTSDLAEALNGGADVILASASLNYISDPKELLHNLCANSSFVILARLPLWPIKQHAAAVQHTQRRPLTISYPTWFFSEDLFMAEIPTGSSVMLVVECPEDRAAFSRHYSTYRTLVIATELSAGRHWG